MRPSATAWQATRLAPAPIAFGASLAHLSFAQAQRGWKVQPGGGSIGDGNSPVSLVLSPRRDGSATGVLDKSARV